LFNAGAATGAAYRVSPERFAVKKAALDICPVLIFWEAKKF
jgi:hypothetical protein